MQLRLDVNYRRRNIKISNIWRQNNTLLNNQQIIEEIKKEIKICIEMKENENTTTQNLWDTVKAMLRGRFIATQAYLKKQVQFSRSVVSNSLQPHELQHTRPPCPSPTPGIPSDSCPSSQWCHPAISSSVVPFSSCPQSLPASESFTMSQLFAWRAKVLEFQL